GSKRKDGGAKPTNRGNGSDWGDKLKKKDKGKGPTSSSSDKAKQRDCFLCGGPHWARDCPQRHKLTAMIAKMNDEPPQETRLGAMHLEEEAKLANMRLLNTSKVVEKEPAGQASTTTQGMGIKQGGRLMVVNGEVNEVPTRLLVDTGASHNFLARREAKALGVKFTKVDGVVKSINSRAMPVYGRAWDVPIRLGKWKGKIDFLVIDIDDEDVVLGMEFLAKVRPFTVSDGMLTITSKGSEVGIKLAQAWNEMLGSHL
ncbi:Retroviral-like aspartic protease 1, partial [Bienertia sinuspersici]